MKDWVQLNNFKQFKAITFSFFFICILSLIKSYPPSLNDFGNYYYGSKLLLDGKFTFDIYSGLHYFNEQIKGYGETHFFENYIPVPPFTAVFYSPFCIWNSLTAKFVFNLISIIFLSISMNRFIHFLNCKPSWMLALIPILLFVPIHNNLYQGQSYLLITALLIESFLFSEQGKWHSAAFCLSLCIALKIFPAFFILSFLIKKNYKVSYLTVFYFLALQLLTIFFIHPSIVSHYYLNIVPRLMNNDIIGPHYFSNQSFFTLFLNLFSYDALNNAHTLMNFPSIVPFIESLVVAVVLAFIFEAKSHKNQVLFGLSGFGLLLISRYNTSYALLLSLPFLLMLTSTYKLSPLIITMLISFALAFTIPVSSLQTAPFLVQYLRLFFLLFSFLLFLIQLQVSISFKTFGAIFIVLVSIRYLMYSYTPFNYFNIQNSKGLMYDCSLTNDTLILKSTLGDRDLVEKFASKGYFKKDTALKIINNQVVYHHQAITNTHENKLNPFLYKDTSVVFMSDLNQGIAFYKLRMVPLHSSQSHIIQ